MGAIRIAGIWRTTAPPEDVWAVVVDLGTWPQWWPAIQNVEPLAGEPGTPDRARFTFDTPSPLRPLPLEVHVVEREAPARLIVRTDGGALLGDGTLTIDRDEDGSSTSFDVRLRVRSMLLRPIEMVLASATRGVGRARLAQAGDDLARLAGGEPLEHSI